MEKWGDKKEVKKGNIGEDYVYDILNKKGFIIYKPINDGSHKIDFFCHSGKEKRVICVEAKSKRRMAKYAKTGFNYNCFLHYKEMLERHNINTFVFFIDDFEGCIYGQWLHKLSDGKIIKDVIVWELSQMKMIRKLTTEEIKNINEFTRVNYDYSNVEKYFK